MLSSVEKAVFNLSSSLMAICQYPFLYFMLEKYLVPFNDPSAIFVFGSVNLSFLVTLMGPRKSMKKRYPLFFSTHTDGLRQGLVQGSITPISNILPIRNGPLFRENRILIPCVNAMLT